MSEFKVGDKVRILAGWWVSFYDPIVDTNDMGTESDGTQTGRVVRKHKHPSTLYVSLDNGRLVSTAIDSLEKIGDAND